MKFLSNENLLLAYKKAKKSRKDKQEVYVWDLNLEENLLNLKSDLQNHKYTHGNYKNIILFDSKKRYISSPNFRDHIVHHMVHNILYDVLDKKLIHQTYACRTGYGAHKAILYLQSICKKATGNDYYLKVDISKYFYSINHFKLKQIIFKYVKDFDLRYVVETIIDSYITGKQFDNLFGYNSKFIQNTYKGLPIGSILSQLFANFYLHKLDSFVKHTLKVQNYLRYMDDFLFIGEKNHLKDVKIKVIDFIYDELDLVINPKKISFNLVYDGVKFVGYKVRNNKVYVGKVTKTKTNKFIDILEKVDFGKFTKLDLQRLNSSLQSRFGVFSHSSFGLKYFKKRGDIDFHSWG